MEKTEKMVMEITSPVYQSFIDSFKTVISSSFALKDVENINDLPILHDSELIKILYDSFIIISASIYDVFFSLYPDKNIDFALVRKSLLNRLSDIMKLKEEKP